MKALHSAEQFRDLLGDRLRALRAQRRWPLKRVAAELGVSVAIVSSWERGMRFPRGSHLCMLAGLFDLPVCQLLYRGTTSCPVAMAKDGPVHNTYKKGALVRKRSA